ncbi:MAG: hypothetical protein ABI311_14295 [Gemmatimonadaceae bacterium]
MFTRTDEARECSDACLEISCRHIGKQLRAQFLDDRDDSNNQRGSRLGEMQCLRALVVWVRPADDQIAAFELIYEPDNARPLDVQPFGKITLTYAASLTDTHKRRSQGSRKPERSQLIVIAAADFLPKGAN